MGGYATLIRTFFPLKPDNELAAGAAYNWREQTMTLDGHILHLMQKASQEIDRKYRAGQAEHGGNLWEKFTPLQFLYHLRDEITDSFVYVQCAIDKLEKEEKKSCIAGQS